LTDQIRLGQWQKYNVKCERAIPAFIREPRPKNCPKIPKNLYF